MDGSPKLGEGSPKLRGSPRTALPVGIPEEQTWQSPRQVPPPRCESNSSFCV